MVEIQKELKDISLPITEPEYRAMPELSYSTLSTYESLGFTGLDHLFDKKESASLLIGSVTDSLITGGKEEFNNNFIVLNINVTDSGIDICKSLIDQGLPFDTFEEIPESIVSQVAKEVGFWQNDKYDNSRYKQVLKCGNVAEYYNALKHNDKTVISSGTFQTALAMVRALKESPATRNYFADDDPSSSIRRYYQLKFRADLEGVGYRCMMDEVIVDYKNKVIYPIDLKTSSEAEWDFEKAFVRWHYYIQAVLYAAILKDNLSRDSYFKDFTMKNYKFIVVNKKTLTPLVWEFPYTYIKEDLIDTEGNIWRHPFKIGKELRRYLDNRPPVPDGISIDTYNTLKCLTPIKD